ncbi:MAG: ribonuclease III [Erysipelotrichaceae bacterium]
MYTIFDWLKEHDINIKQHALLNQALVHSSYVNEHKSIVHDNERLEFMGDAVLQVWSAQKLFLIEPELSEGEMTTLRAQLVCEETLAAYNRQFNWGQFLLLGIGEEKMGGRNRDSILADMFEAVLGAIYLDQGIHAINVLLEQVVTPMITSPKSERIIDYKTKLQEYVQSDSRKTVHYELLSMVGPSNKPRFEVAVILEDITLGKGEGYSKKRAEQMAAKDAFEKMVK